MNSCTYLNDPGIFHDMINALKLRFNGERVYIPLRGTSVAYMENEKFYSIIIDRLSHVSEKLLPLFYFDRDKNIKTAINTYISKYIALTEDGLFDTFYESLRDVNRLKQTVYQNYISAECPEVFDMTTLPLVKNHIFDADLPADMKMYLLNFLLFGESEIEKIIGEFQKAEAFARELHKIRSNEKAQLVSMYGNNDVMEALSKQLVVDISSYEKVYFTFTIILTDIICYETYNKTYLSIIGITAAKNLEISNSSCNNFNVNLYELGRILYDNTRLTILKLLSEENMYCAQIAKKLGLKNNSTLYHLNMMEMEGLIKQIGTGKKKYYCINSTYLAQIKKLIDNKFTGEFSNEQKKNSLD